ncbi:cytochrome d ubiquinol oxidase subunit II [Xanthomonas sp. XNM01]|uniref:cytochrome d ubiquinol oxidase subunit II n=1 Tax=Xanthomonas sp. XNM01 TaxID=2769289 RepID=UPI0031BA4B44
MSHERRPRCIARAAQRAWHGPRTDVTPRSRRSRACAPSATLGACWLIWKTDGITQQHAFRLARGAGALLLLGIVAVSLATLGLDYDYHQRWLTYPAVLVTAQVPLLTLLIAWAFFRCLRRRREGWPFLLALALFLLTFIGLAVSVFPYVVPEALTIWDAAAPERSQGFMLVGAVVLVPVILAYTGWSYWVFRGKVAHEGYH